MLNRKRFFALVTLAALAGCGGGTTNNLPVNGTPTSIANATLAPNPVAVGKTAVGSATVVCTGAGTCPQDLAWTAPANGGSFAGSTYTAPATAGTYTVSVSPVGYPLISATVKMVVTAPPTGTLSVSPASIVSGSSATLTWATTNAASINVDNGVGAVTPVSGGSISVSPTKDTTYTATIVGNDGSTVTKTAAVTVTAPPVPTGTLSVNPTSIVSGSSATLTWATTNATSISIDNGLGTMNPVAGGNVSISPTKTTTYTATITGAGGTITATATVTVTAPPVPTGTLSVNPTSIVSGSSATLTWATTNATSISIDNGLGTMNPVAGGSISVTPLSTTTYTATITGAGGTAHATATITVTAPPVSITASCLPQSVPQGQTAECMATVLNATNTAVTWSASVGTITTAGLLSTTGVPVGTIVVTATSVADPTKSATADVAVITRVITIGTQFPVISLPSVTPHSVVGRRISLTGGQTGDVVSMTLLGTTTTITVTSTMASAGYVDETINLAPTYYAPGYVKIVATSSDNTIQSNTVWIAITTDQQVLVESKDATTAYFAPGVALNDQKYSLTDGSNQGATDAWIYSLAVDEKTGHLLENIAGEGVNWDDISYDLPPGGIGDYSEASLIAIAAKNGLGYATNTKTGQIGQFDLTQNHPTPIFVTAGNGAWTLDAATVNGADAIAEYSKEDTTVSLFDNKLNLKSYLTLTGVTQASVVFASTFGGGGWPIRFIGSQIVLLDAPGKQLIFIGINSDNVMKEAGRVSLDGNPAWITADPINSRVVTSYNDLATGGTILKAFAVTAPFTETDIASASALPKGFLTENVLVSDDGKNLYVAGIDKTGKPAFFIIPNQ